MDFELLGANFENALGIVTATFAKPPCALVVVDPPDPYGTG